MQQPSVPVLPPQDRFGIITVNQGQQFVVLGLTGSTLLWYDENTPETVAPHRLPQSYTTPLWSLPSRSFDNRLHEILKAPIHSPSLRLLLAFGTLSRDLFPEAEGETQKGGSRIGVFLGVLLIRAMVFNYLLAATTRKNTRIISPRSHFYTHQTLM